MGLMLLMRSWFFSPYNVDILIALTKQTEQSTINISMYFLPSPI